MNRPALLAALSALLLSACWVDDPLPSAPPRVSLSGDLDLDIRSSAHVEIVATGSAVDATLSLSNGFGVAAGQLHGTGTVEAFPEASVTLYTARIDAPADASGPCGAQPVSLALSLHRRGKDAHVGGSLTAYCGASTWHGVPARLLRLAGDLPLP